MGGGRGTERVSPTYNGLFGEAPPERGTCFRLGVGKRALQTNRKVMHFPSCRHVKRVPFLSKKVDKRRKDLDLRAELPDIKLCWVPPPPPPPGNEGQKMYNDREIVFVITFCWCKQPENRRGQMLVMWKKNWCINACGKRLTMRRKHNEIQRTCWILFIFTSFVTS